MSKSITVRSFIVAGSALLVSGAAHAFSESTGQIYLSRGYSSAETSSESKAPTVSKADEAQATPSSRTTTDTSSLLNRDK